MLLLAHHLCAMSPQCGSKGHHFLLWPLRGALQEGDGCCCLHCKPALNVSSDAVGGLEQGPACLCWQHHLKGSMFKVNLH